MGLEGCMKSLLHDMGSGLSVTNSLHLVSHMGNVSMWLALNVFVMLSKVCLLNAVLSLEALIRILSYVQIEVFCDIEWNINSHIFKWFSDN